MLPAERLRDKLVAMSGKGFQAYQDLAGAYRFERFVLYLDSVQTDPVAAASRARVRIDQAEAQVPGDLWSTPQRHVALADFLARRVQDAVRKHVRSRWSGRQPPLSIDVGGSTVLTRTSCALGEDHVEVRLAIGLPAEGRKVLTKAAQTLLFDELPAVVAASLVWSDLDGEAGRRHVQAVEDYFTLQDALVAHNLVAFVADGSVLPREGTGEGPLRGRAVPMRAPDELAVTVTLPHRGEVRGLGIPRGVTVITGGAFSGKSTLVAGIGSGVYPHMPGDGRELVVTVPDAVTIRAEAGRRIERVDVSAFIREVPQRHDVTALSLEHPSGVLSMAAATAEALEVGTALLLCDEDDGAVAFLARDALMQQLVPAPQQPVIPLVDHLRPLWETHGISSIVATSGLGDYLGVADTVIVMEGFQPVAATERARHLIASRDVRRAQEAPAVRMPAPRCPLPRGFAGLRGRQRIEMRGRGILALGRETVDIAGLHQLGDAAQARAAAAVILLALEKGYFDGNASLMEAIDRVFAHMDRDGLDVLASENDLSGDYAWPRRHEVAAILNRMRALHAQPRRAGAEPPASAEPLASAEDPGNLDQRTGTEQPVSGEERASAGPLALPEPNRPPTP
jgi:predicted ABC-class ATPase